jgi:hypothetical protein
MEKNVVEVIETSTRMMEKEKEDRGREYLLMKEGMDRPTLYRTIVEGMKAKKVVRDRYGDVVAEEADWIARGKFAGLAVEVLGEKAKGDEGVRMSPIVIKLPDGTMVGVGAVNG